jgi:hypothetical protein
MLRGSFYRVLMLTVVCLGITVLLPFQSAEAKPQYLPYGVPVPQDQPVTVPPKPYDPATDPPPIANTQPEKNLAKDPKYKDKLPKKGKPSKKGLPSEYPGTGDAGFYINGNFQAPLDSSGIYAGNDAQLNLVIPTSSRDVTIYAPTHMPPNNTCLETTTVHFRPVGQNYTQHAHGF